MAKLTDEQIEQKETALRINGAVFIKLFDLEKSLKQAGEEYKLGKLIQASELVGEVTTHLVHEKEELEHVLKAPEDAD